MQREEFCVQLDLDLRRRQQRPRHRARAAQPVERVHRALQRRAAVDADGAAADWTAVGIVVEDLRAGHRGGDGERDGGEERHAAGLESHEEDLFLEMWDWFGVRPGRWRGLSPIAIAATTRENP